MRKRAIVALLAVLGFAFTAAPAVAQALTIDSVVSLSRFEVQVSGTVACTESSGLEPGQIEMVSVAVTQGPARHQANGTGYLINELCGAPLGN